MRLLLLRRLRIAKWPRPAGRDFGFITTSWTNPITSVQDLDTPTGNYWHALLHRREPDFSNSKYWFRRVRTHPVFEALRIETARLATEGPTEAGFLARQARWDPFAFVDLCEASYDAKATCHELCLQVQRVEWELLFDHCYRRAVGH